MTQDRKKRILIFGGSFDPPHEGHEGLARYAIEHGIADEVWFTPCGQHAFDKRMSPKENRTAMTKLVVDGLNEETGSEKFKLCTIEVEKEGTSFMLDTLEQVVKENHGVEVGFLMGEDQLKRFEQWGNWQKLLEEFAGRIFVYPRGEDSRHLLKKGMVYLEGAPKIERESTGIRKEVASSDERETHGVRPTVQEYIANHYEEMYGRSN